MDGEANPILVSHRSTGAPTAFVFLHGFGGDTSATWGKFPAFVVQDKRLKSWDVFGLGYPSTLRVDIVLGGRFKRRWLVERNAEDLARARQLYSEGLEQAEKSADSAQIYYHAINIAFLDLLSTPANSAPNPNVRAKAELALAHCAKAPETHWRIETEA